MKKVLFFACLLCGAFAFTSCDDDEVAKKYEVKVTVSADGADLASLQDLSVKCMNQSGNVEASTSETEYIYKLVAGTYTVQGSASNDEFNFLGEETFTIADQDMAVSLKLTPAPKAKSGLIFKEIYYTGVPSYYFKDGFYELVNNSDEVQYLDGILFTQIDRGYGDEGSNWMDSLGNKPKDFYPLDGYVFQFPGSGKDYPVEPGQSIVIASQAYNHGSTGTDPRELTDEDAESPAGDLSTADWELNIPSKPTNYDNPNVPSLNIVWSNATTICFFGVFGFPLCIAQVPEGYASVEEFVNDSINYNSYAGGQPKLCIPTSAVIDAVDVQRHGESKIVKVFWPTEDAGYTYATGADPSDPEYSTDFESWISPSYTGKSVRRKCTMVTESGRAYFKDTNNSTEDFILGGQTAVVRRQFTQPD